MVDYGYITCWLIWDTGIRADELHRQRCAFWDATTTCFAITGMWLMARKKLENWIAWIICDLISIPLYFYKGLVLTSVQFLLFTGLACAGYLAWKKSLERESDRFLERENS